MPIWFYIENAGEVVANDVRLEGQLDDAGHFFQLRGETQMRQKPRREAFSYFPGGFTASTLSVEQVPGGWIMHGSIGKLQPKQQLVTRSCLFAGARHSGSAELDMKVFSDSPSSPVEEEMYIHVLTGNRTLSLEDLRDLANADGDG